MVDKPPKRRCCYQNAIMHCERSGTYPDGDQIYCWQHRRDKPYLDELYAAAKAKRMEEHRKRQERLDEHDRMKDRERLERVAGIDKLTNEELIEMASLGGAQQALAALRKFDL